MSVSKQRLSYLAADYLSTLMGVIIFTAIRYHVVDGLGAEYGSISAFYRSEGVLATIFLFPPAMLLVYYLSGYYVSVCNKSRMKEFLVTAVSIAVGTIIFFMVILINDVLPGRLFNYELLFILAATLFICVYPVRLSLTTLYKRKLHTESGVRKMIVVGTGNPDDFTRKNQAVLDAEGMKIVGMVEADIQADELNGIVKSGAVDGFLLNIPSNDRTQSLQVLNCLFPYELPVYITPDAYELVMSKVRCDNILSEPLIDVSRSDFPDHVVAMKRFSDILYSSFGLVFLAPVILFLGMVVKIQSPGPVIYTQERVGYHKRTFKIYKLRSMCDGAEGDTPMLSGRNDERITPIGHFMRKYRLDELPNLWNVLRGDMSIIGPRPERKYFIDKISKIAPYYALLHQVRPGLTSWGMVKYGYASSIEQMVERLRYDILYIQNLTPSLDFKIAFYTVRTILKGEGV